MSPPSSERPTILVVDDTPENLTVLSDLLKDTYRVLLAKNGEKALKLATENKPEIILLDIMMPDMDGHEVCRRLKADAATCTIPIIFLTAMQAPEDETKGLELGAVDFITKPFNPAILLARVATHLKLKTYSDFLEREVAERTRELAAIQDVTILAMASLAETRDNETGNHIRRTQHYIRILARRASGMPRYHSQLDEAMIETLFKSAPLHDIGKVGIPDRILLKPGHFEPAEFEIMKTHTTLGRKAIEHAEEQLGIEVGFLRTAKEIAQSHQEKWDGSGYPEGLSGDAIPLSARLMAVADVYDALISRRVYKEGMPHDQAIGIIKAGRGSHFDPDLVDLFMGLANEFRAIAERYGDSDADMAHKARQAAHAVPAGGNP
jgi:putative two-component system response regulator